MAVLGAVLSAVLGLLRMVLDAGGALVLQTLRVVGGRLGTVLAPILDAVLDAVLRSGGLRAVLRSGGPVLGAVPGALGGVL